MGSLEGKVILITGASGGIGHATARHLHDEGAAVVATAPSSSQIMSVDSYEVVHTAGTR